MIAVVYASEAGKPVVPPAEPVAMQAVEPASADAPIAAQPPEPQNAEPQNAEPQNAEPANVVMQHADAVLTVVPPPIPPRARPTIRRVRDDDGAGPDLEYRVLTTGGAAPTDRLPLVVALHGRGERGTALVELLGELEVPARVVVPEGPVAMAHGRRAWFGPRAKRVAEPVFAHAVGARAFGLAHFVDRLTVDFSTCGKPMVLGFSQGGILALVLALQYPGHIDGAFSIAGTIPADFVPTSYRPHARMWDWHGMRDRKVDYGYAADSLRRLHDFGFQATMHAYPDVAHRPNEAMDAHVVGHIDDELRRLAQTCQPTGA